VKSIGILGVGQAGGNIAEIATTLGFQTALINKSWRQLTMYGESRKRVLFMVTLISRT